MFVRITHWINSAGFLALVVSGIAILIAHPRLYWGETGTVGMPSLIDLPIPFTFGHSGWGRYLHFLSAWICVLNGALYMLMGALDGHFKNQFLGHATYGFAQRLTYLGVVFALAPIMLATGLAMSPAITSAVPAAVDFWGGQQSARTIHFVVAAILVLFLFAHVTMVVWSRSFRSPISHTT